MADRRISDAAHAHGNGPLSTRLLVASVAIASLVGCSNASADVSAPQSAQKVPSKRTAYPEVPARPASHGCVRLPVAEAPFAYTFMAIGTHVTVF